MIKEDPIREWSTEKIDPIVETFYEKLYPDSRLHVASAGRKNTYRLNPCPICGHNDCATVYAGEGSGTFCFSNTDGDKCKFSGSHVGAYLSYCKSKGIAFRNGYNSIAEVVGERVPSDGFGPSEYSMTERIEKIRRIALDQFKEELRTNDQVFLASKDGKQYTPMDYLMHYRKVSRRVIEEYDLGFTGSFDKNSFKKKCADLKFTEEEIEESKILNLYRNVFVFFYKDTHGKITRYSIKNAFGVKRVKKNEFGQWITTEKEVDNITTTPKKFFFSVRFDEKKPLILVEGEHDLLAIVDHGDYENVVATGGNFKDEDMLAFLKNIQAPIFACFDNDAAGEIYVERIVKLLPHKDIRHIVFDRSVKDIDDYYKNTDIIREPMPELMEKADKVFSDEIYIECLNPETGRDWLAASREKSLRFSITNKGKEGYIGGIDYFVSGSEAPNDRKLNTGILSATKPYKSLAIKLSDAISAFFNSNLTGRSFESLCQIYALSDDKVSIKRRFAEIIYELRKQKDDDSESEYISKLALIDPNLKDEVGNIMNEISSAELTSGQALDVSRIKLSQHFDVPAKKAYMYYIRTRKEGETIKKVPYLISNKKENTRLDILKKADPQSMLLFDGKYELPREVPVAEGELQNISLHEYWANEYASGRLGKRTHLHPKKLLESIEGYLRKFWYHPDESVFRVLALYIYSTFYYTLFTAFPYLLITGPAGSGKTNLDMVFRTFVFCPTYSINLSTAALFRQISTLGGTLVLDEMEYLKNKKALATQQDLASILKGGYRSPSPVLRFNPDLKTNETFDSYGPKIISNIEGIEPVIMERCIKIRAYTMKVTNETKIPDPSDYFRNYQAEVKEVSSKCCLSALEYFEELYEMSKDEILETGFSARLSQIIHPLYTIARLITKLDVEEQGLTGEAAKNHRSDYEKGLLDYYNTTISKDKMEEAGLTDAGIIKAAIKGIADELLQNVPKSNFEYLNYSEHQFSGEIKHDEATNTFSISYVHFRMYLEERSPEHPEDVSPRMIRKIVKDIYGKKEIPVRRQVVKLNDNPELLKKYGNVQTSKREWYVFSLDEFTPTDTSKPDFASFSETDHSSQSGADLF